MICVTLSQIMWHVWCKWWKFGDVKFRQQKKGLGYHWCHLTMVGLFSGGWGVISFSLLGVCKQMLMASPTWWTWVWASSGVGDGQGSLAYCSPWGRRVQHNWATELTDWSRCWLNLPVREAIWDTLTVTEEGGGRAKLADFCGSFPFWTYIILNFIYELY